MRPRRGRGSFIERTITNAINSALSSVIHTTVHKVANTVVDTSVNKYKATKEAELARYKLEQKKADAQAAAAFLNRKYGEGTVTLTIRDSYQNMADQIRPHWHLVDNAMEAMRRTGVEPVTVPIRGGTDGARLSFEGLPCPNLCTGGENYHGRFEYIPVEDMELCTRMLIEIMTAE